MESAIGQPPPPSPPPPEPLAVTWTLDISSVPSNGGRVEHECPAVHCQDRIFGSYDYLDGQTASITARAYSGYRFSHWSGAASGSRSSRTVYMDRDRSVTAHWERIPAVTYNLRVIADPSDGRGGYVEITGGTLVSAGTKRFTQGARAVVEARSNTGWRFVRWSGDVSGSSARQTLTMNSDKTATALFQRATIQRTLTAHVVGNGRVIPSGSTYHDNGSFVGLQAIPDRGYRLRGWSGSVSGTDPWITVHMNQDRDAIATFERAPITRYELSVSVSGRGSVSGAGTYDADQTVTLRATADQGYRFVRWAGDASGTRSSLTLRVTAAATVRAVFERSSYTLTVEANPQGGSAGHVEIEGGTLVRPGQKRFTSGERATLTAHTSTGWSFSGWSGVLRGSQPVQSIVIDADKSVTARWVRSEQRPALFSSRSLPDRTWQVGSPVTLRLPRATRGSGSYNYSIKYEWNGDQSWTPAGVTFSRNTLQFSGVLRAQLNRNQSLRRFSVILRVEDRVSTGEWDELTFVVHMTPAATQPTTAANSDSSLNVRIAARRLADGRIEFALQPVSGNRILPRSRFFPARPQIGRWLSSSAIEYGGQDLGRISAQRLPDGRTEFGFIPKGGTRILPASRFFPADTSRTNWLRSSSFSPRSASPHTSVSDQNARQLASTYAPILRFDSREMYFPVSAELMLAFSTLKLHRGIRLDRTLIDSPTTAQLADHREDSNDLEEFVDFNEQRWRSVAPNLLPTVYARVLVAKGRTVVQYWLLYVFNPGPPLCAVAIEVLTDSLASCGFPQQHEGDWEGIQVMFDADADIDNIMNGNEAPQYIWYSTHSDGELYLWDSLIVDKGDRRPNVYVALGSHANYPDRGVQQTSTIYDVNNGRGAVFSRFALTLIDESTDWVTWHGRWGEIGIAQGAGDPWSGPRGPIQKVRWHTPGSVLPK